MLSTTAARLYKRTSKELHIHPSIVQQLSSEKKKSSQKENKTQGFSRRQQIIRDMASSVLLCTLIVLISSIIPGFYSLPTARDNSEVEQPAALLDRERRLADDCITHIYVSAHTSRQGGTGGGTNSEHDIEFNTGPTTSYKSALIDLPGDQATIGKGDLWKLSLTAHFGVPVGTCIRKLDITRVAIEENSNDGWLIDSIITVVKKHRDDAEVLTIDLDKEKWIDGDGNPSEQPGVVEIFPLNLV